jgi:hypothetical protein
VARVSFMGSPGNIHAGCYQCRFSIPPLPSHGWIPEPFDTNITDECYLGQWAANGIGYRSGPGSNTVRPSMHTAQRCLFPAASGDER